MGKWQKRYFETNGNFLTYYESKKMTKLLAAVNLPQVGEIKVIPPDPENDDTRDGGLFTIQLNSRDYTLKAADHEEALGWVEVLRNLKDIDKKDETAGAEGPKKTAATQPTAEVKKESRVALAYAEVPRPTADRDPQLLITTLYFIAAMCVVELFLI